jgi:2'-hydroxyisoflavone reductase
LIVGKFDVTDRFTYWPYRIDKGGEVLAPGSGNDIVQFIDSRDLAEFTIRMAENRTFGIYNATGPEKPLTMAEMLYGIKGVTTAGAQFTWVPAEFLTANNVRGWSNMPVWIAPRENNVGFSQRSIQRALSKGLTFRTLAVTTRDTLDWNKTRPAEDLKKLADGLTSGVSAAREKEILDLWKQKQASMEKP